METTNHPKAPSPEHAVSNGNANHHQNQNQNQNNNIMTATSHVNGRGLWRSWQRSFRRPLDALLDLMDNAVDANHGKGRIRISRLSDHDDDDEQPGQHQGVLLLNSYDPCAYKEMHKILEVFSSQKEQQAIGENGVGVKQASASLSNFSVVVTKRRARFQVGMLCASLQSDEGIFLPSYTFPESCNPPDWEDECEKLCEQDAVFRECMEYLGGQAVKVNDDTKSDDEDVKDEMDRAGFRHAGQDRLLELFSHMYASGHGWDEHECVFALLLDQLRIEQPAKALLTELSDTLAQTYLHLQASQCDIQIQEEPVQFQYWERRLTELSCFPVYMSKTVPIMAPHASLAQPPQGHNNVNMLRVFVGFDPKRSANKDEQALCCLYIYSRECGRLVKFMSDARQELNLSGGGTMYCQGLTVIVDDYESSLPLTPTKQEIAWSDGAAGHIHRNNFNAWVRAVTNAYYTYHLAQFDGKKELNDAVKSHCPLVDSLIKEKRDGVLTPLTQHTLFSTFENIQWARHTLRLVPKNKKTLRLKAGRATLLNFDRNTTSSAAPPAARPRRQPRVAARLAPPPLPPLAGEKLVTPPRAHQQHQLLPQYGTEAAMEPRQRQPPMEPQQQPQQPVRRSPRRLSERQNNASTDQQSLEFPRDPLGRIGEPNHETRAQKRSRSEPVGAAVVDLLDSGSEDNEDLTAGQGMKLGPVDPSFAPPNKKRPPPMYQQTTQQSPQQWLEQELYKKNQELIMKDQELSMKDQELSQKDGRIKALERALQKSKQEKKQLEVFSSNQLTKLHRQNRELRDFQTAMSEQLAQRNQQILALEEELG